MEEINVEQIMQEIRAEIKEKGYKESDLSFNDIQIKQNDTGELGEILDLQRLVGLINAANASTRVDFYRPITDGGLKGLVKKAIRKLMKPLLLPLCQSQESYNGILVQTINQMKLYVDEQEKRINDLEAIITREGK
jgi:hypothetical protein